MWLTGRLAPDFKTIADFRRDSGKGIRNVCRQFVMICRQLKLCGARTHPGPPAPEALFPPHLRGDRGRRGHAADRIVFRDRGGDGTLQLGDRAVDGLRSIASLTTFSRSSAIPWRPSTFASVFRRTRMMRSGVVAVCFSADRMVLRLFSIARPAPPRTHGSVTFRICPLLSTTSCLGPRIAIPSMPTTLGLGPKTMALPLGMRRLLVPPRGSIIRPLVLP